MQAQKKVDEKISAGAKGKIKNFKLTSDNYIKNPHKNQMITSRCLKSASNCFQNSGKKKLINVEQLEICTLKIY